MENNQEQIAYVMMRRTTDGDGPHPIHPDEVMNYTMGDWVVVEGSEEPKVEHALEEYNRRELLAAAAEYKVEIKPQMKNAEIIAAIRAADGYDASEFALTPEAE